LLCCVKPMSAREALGRACGPEAECHTIVSFDRKNGDSPWIIRKVAASRGTCLLILGLSECDWPRHSLSLVSLVGAFLEDARGSKVVVAPSGEEDAQFDARARHLHDLLPGHWTWHKGLGGCAVLQARSHELARGWPRGDDFSVHFFVRPDGRALPLQIEGRQGVQRTVTVWPLCVLRQAGAHAQAETQSALAYILGSNPRSCLVCDVEPNKRGTLACVAQSAAAAPPLLRADAPVAGDSVTLQNLKLIRDAVRLLRAGLPYVFNKDARAVGDGSELCASTSRLSDSQRRCQETIDTLCQQTRLLSADVLAPEPLSLREQPAARSEVEAANAPRRLSGMGLVVACACSAEKPLAVVRWRSAACRSLWIQSTLLHDAHRLDFGALAGSVLIENVAVFRHGFASATAGNLENTWLPLEKEHEAPGARRPLPWFPGAALYSPFLIDVLIASDRAPSVPRTGDVFLDEDVASLRQWRSCWPPGALVPTLTPRRPAGAPVRQVAFIFACFPALTYQGDAYSDDTLGEICARSLEQEGLPLVPWETVVDQYVPFAGSAQLSWLSQEPFPARVLLQERRGSPRIGRGVRTVPELERSVGIDAPAFRLLQVLRGRLQSSATSAGLGFILNPLLWWSLAKLHYQSNEQATVQVTGHFFPLRERAWTSSMPPGSSRGRRSAFKGPDAQRAWDGYLTAADKCLARRKGRRAVLASWLALLNAPLGAALVRLLDESVTYFVAECATDLRRAQVQIEQLQKVLFSFEGFVPLCFSTWDPGLLERWRSFGAVPHSNATLLRPPSVASGFRLAKTPYGDKLYIEDLTLVGLLSSSAAPASSAARLANARGAALALILQTLHELIFTPKYKQSAELFPAVLFARSSPMPGLLYDAFRAGET
jgi:hypothetical protein